MTGSPLVDTTDAAGRASGNRLQSLDALRGVAVAFVVAQHLGETTLADLRQFTAESVQFGQMGVMVFFLCSGFIIPAALERNASLRTFWVNRFFRLYPMYWASLIGAGILAVTHEPFAHQLNGPDWAANATMAQSFVGAPHAVGVYWSLSFELAFYVLMSVLFAVRLHRRTVELQALAQLGCIALALAVPVVLDREAPLGIFNIATMFTGTLIYRHLVGDVSRAALGRGLALAAAAGATVLAAGLGGEQPVFDDGTHRLVPMLAAWIGAYAIFGAGLWLWRGGAPRPLRFLGLISYSVYLVHALVVAAVPRTDTPLLTVAVWVAVVIGVSWITWRLIERPSISLGRDLVRRYTAPRRAAVPEPA